MVEQDVSESGKEFQIVGPADLNPREPNTVLTSGTQNRCALEHWTAWRIHRNIKLNEGLQNVIWLWCRIT